jgi:hypothetical protein
MTTKVLNEGEILREATEILAQHMSPAKVARFWADWQLGQGDYLAWKDETFAAETVDSLYEAIKDFQASHD